jgi:hypothetical protein
MSSVPIVGVSFSIDLTGSGVSLTSVLPAPSNLPTTYLQVDCSRAALFPSGVNYNLVTNASGIITTLSGVAHTASISASHVVTQAGGTGSWRQAAAAGNVFDLSFNFNSTARQVRYNLAKAATVLSGANDLGRHLMLMATHAVQLRDPSGANDVFDAPTVTSAAATLNTNIATALRTVLNTQAAQDALLQAIIRANGPVVPPTTTANANISTSLAYDASWNGLIMYFIITQLPVTVSFYGTNRSLVLQNVPLYVQVT